MLTKELPGLPMKEDQATQQFMRRSIEQALSGNVKRQREIAARISQAQTETPLYGAVMDVADLTGMPHPPGIVYFVQNEGTFYYYNSVTPAFEPIINGVGSVADGSVTNAKLANMSAATVKGQIVGGSGAPIDLTAAQLNAIVASANIPASITISASDVDSIFSRIINTQSGAGLLLYATGTTAHSITDWIDSGVIESNSLASGGLVFSAYTGDIAFQTGARTNRMTIDTNGHIGIGAAPHASYMQIIAESTADGVITVIRNLQSGAEFNMFATGTTSFGITDWIDSGVIESNSLASGGLVFSAYAGDILFQTDARTNRAAINSTGLGIGTINPQGNLHILAASGGKLFTTKTAIDGTAQTLIPDGTGDATIGVKAFYIATGSGGTSTFGSGDFLNNTDNTIFTTGGGSVLKFRVNSNGSVDLRRSSGSETFTVVVDMIWR